MFKAKTLMIDTAPTLLLAVSAALVWRLDKRQHSGARLCQHAAASSRQLVAPLAPGKRPRMRKWEIEGRTIKEKDVTQGVRALSSEERRMEEKPPDCGKKKFETFTNWGLTPELLLEVTLRLMAR